MQKRLMKLLKRKKAQGLPMNVVIIAIIVVVVLIILIVFFLGGFTSLGQKIKEILGMAIAGTDMESAKLWCQQYCDRGLETAWCSKTFRIDSDANGEAEFTTETGKKMYIDYFCGEDHTTYEGEIEERDIGLACPDISC